MGGECSVRIESKAGRSRTHKHGDEFLRRLWKGWRMNPKDIGNNRMDFQRTADPWGWLLNAAGKLD